MKRKILAVTLLAILFLALPIFANAVFADVTEYYDLKVTVRENTAQEDSITADSIKIFYSPSGVLAKDKNNNDAVCTNCHEHTFTLASGSYIISVMAKQYIPKNVTYTLQSKAQRIIYLDSDTVAPSSTLTLEPEKPNENGWYNEDVTATLTATDNQGGAGVRYIKYCIDQTNTCNPNNIYTGAITISSEGTNYLRYAAEDWAQNVESTKSQIIKIDQTAPTVSNLGAKTESGGSDINEQEWQTDNDPYFYWSFYDGTSGIAGFSVALDESADETVDVVNAFYQYGDDSLSDGKHIFYVKALDKAGNWGQEQSFEIWVDASTPDIIEIKAYTDSNMGTEIGNGIWQTDGTPYFVWTDPNSASDDTFYYTLDGSEPNENSNSLSDAVYDRTSNAFSEGTTVLKVKPRNGAGTWGATRTFTLKYDETAPSTTIALNPASPDGLNNWYVSDVTVTLSCNDGMSGCAETKYRIGNGDWVTYTAPFTLSDDGANIVIDYYSTDNAGNSENVQSSSSLKIDKTAPTWSNEAHTDPAVYSKGGSYDFSIDWTDETSGVSTVTFTFDGNNYNPSASGSTYSYTLSDLPAGTYSFKWTATDSAGNSITTNDFTFTVEKAVPSISLSLSPSDNETYGTQTTAMCVVTTGDSGGTVKIYRNGNLVASGQGSASDTNLLGAGNYEYYCEYLESANYTSLTTDVKTLTINKASTSIALYLDGSEWVSDASKTYPTATNVNATIDVAELQPFVILKRNSAAVNNPDSGTLGAGTYVYVAEFAGNENYTSSVSDVRTLTINKASSTVTLLFDGVEGNTTVERGATVNISAVSDVSNALVHIYIDDVEVASGTGSAQYDYDTGSESLTEHKIYAVSDETTNYKSSDSAYYITIQDTKAPIITVISPTNQTTYQQNWILVSITSNEELSGASVSLDGGAGQAMSGSGTSWSLTLTGLSEGEHNITVTATDLASNSNTSDAVFFTIPALSHIVNSTIDGVYYLDVYMNIYSGISTISNSDITDSTITNSTIIDSTVSAKAISNMVIVGSYLDPADFEGSDIRYSNVTENDDNYIRYSNVTNSTILYSDIEYCDITLSSIEYSALENMIIGSANVSHNFLYTGWLYYNGINYTTPTNITNLYENDTTKPVIESITPSNNTPAPGDSITITVVAKDNVAVKSVTLNGTLMNFAGGYSFTWTSSLTVPSADGEYAVPVIASDYAGNQRTRYIGIIVNSSDSPQVRFDLDAPTVSAISPTSATEGTITFMANATDSSEITACWLFIDGVNHSQMNYTNGTAEVDVSMSSGTYEMYVACSDYWGNVGEGPAVLVTINSRGGAAGGGGGAGYGPVIITPLTAEMSIDAPAMIEINAGETKTLTMTLKNTGTGSLSNIRISVTGLPATWLVFSSKISNIPVNSSVTNTITITVPEDEPTGTRTLSISAVSAEGESVSRGVALKVTGKPTPTPPETPANVTPTTPPAPSGITGAIIAITSSPTALGFIVAAIIVGGAILWTRRMPKPKSKKPEKTERKYI